MIQKMFSYSQPEPPRAPTKNDVPTPLSVITMHIPSRKAGMAYRAKAEPTTEAQTKTGRRPIVIPFVRMVKVVVMTLTPERVAETTKAMMQTAKASMAIGAWTDRGAYVVQPASIPPRK